MSEHDKLREALKLLDHFTHWQVADKSVKDACQFIRAHIEAQAAEIARLTKRVEFTRRMAADMAEIAEAADANARRYLFLRDDPPTWLCVRINRDGCNALYTDGAELDTFIDDAMRGGAE